MKSVPFIFFCFLVLIGSNVSGQNKSGNINYSVADTLHENSGLFDSDVLLPVSLRFDITQYKRKRSDQNYLDAVITYHTSPKDSVNKNIKLRSRGNFRREYCDFPPLMLNFKMKDSVKGEFSRINKLKMVTQCKPGNQEFLLKEFLIYKLYNVITENSFRVRLLRVNYINTAKQNKLVKEFAFVIEPIELLARRTSSVEVKTSNLTQKNVKPEAMDRVAIFNYMIGNTDWSVPIQHNILLFSQGKTERPDLAMIVPFDFDYSGLVNTHYAVPFEGLRIKTVLERQYLGICRSEQEFINALHEFLDLKEKFYKVINEFPYLSEKSKKEMISYLDQFFRNFDGRNSNAKKMLLDCIQF